MSEQATAAMLRLGLVLPEVPDLDAPFDLVVQDGDTLYVSGHLPLLDGALVATGPVGDDRLELERAVYAARVAALNALAAAAQAAGGVDQVSRVLRLTVFVAARAGFALHTLVANGASELVREVFGEAGRHARSAIGVASLPRNASVEVELVVTVASTAAEGAGSGDGVAR